MERGHQEVAGTANTVASEDAAGAIGAMRGRGEPDEQQARARVAESGHRPAPVGVIAIGTPFLAGNGLAVAS
jgi:hypothetical protein